MRLPCAVESATPLAVNPAVVRHEVETRTERRGIVRKKSAETVHDPVKGTLMALCVDCAKDVGHVVAVHKQRTLLSGPLEGGSFDGEELHLRVEVVPSSLRARFWRFVIDQQRAVTNAFCGPIQPSWLILDDIQIGVKEVTFSMQDEAE